MNTRFSNRETSPALDAALRRLGSATPDPGMQARLLRRLHTAAMESSSSRHTRSWSWPRLAAAALAGSFACTLVVAGSISHSHTIAQQQAPPMLQLVRPQSGVSTADAAHITAHPVPAPAGKGRAQENATPGRAKVAPGAHAQRGLALPAKVGNR